MQWQVVADALKYGVFYALAKATIESPEPIDGPATWQFWTKDRNKLVTYLAEHYPPQFLIKRFIDGISDDSNIADIIRHYEVPAEFFMLFLDENYHFYSCADFHSPDDSLEQAQINKAEAFLSLIAPRPGDCLLELGCGWGGMMKFLHERLGDSVTVKGITISQTQADFIKKSYGFDDVVVESFVSREYPANQYDCIYSIDAWDHVRPKDTASLVKKLYTALKPGGRLIQQFGVGTRTQSPATFLLGNLFFAGIVPKTLATELAVAENAGFRLLHDTTVDYSQTTKAWYDRFCAHRDEAIRLVGVREFNRQMLLHVLYWKMDHEQYGIMHRLAFEKPASA